MGKDMLRKEIELLFKDANHERERNSSSRYWYPISVLSFGVEEIMQAVDSLCQGQTTMASKTDRFEREFSSLIGSKEAIMVNSGSSADLLIALALSQRHKGLVPGDEILMPAVTWPTQIWSALMANFRVKLVDVNPETLNLSLDDLEAKISPQTRGLFLVHLLGNPCPMDDILALCSRHNLILLEDCCEALGARFDGQHVGTFGLASSFSFFFSHHITTMEGGMVCCDEKDLSDAFRLLRAHGWARNMRYSSVQAFEGLDPRYLFLGLGLNVRPTELQAGFGLEQLKRLPFFNKSRIRNAFLIKERLKAWPDFLQTMAVNTKATCSWFAFPFIVSEDAPFSKSDLVTHLEENGIETRPIVAGNIARQPACKDLSGLMTGELPGADVVHYRGFYIGIHPYKMDEELDRLCCIIDGFMRKWH